MIDEQRRAGRTVLFISHQIADVEQLCDHAAVLRGGRLIYHGSMADLKRSLGPDERPLEEVLRTMYTPGFTLGGQA